MDGLTIAIVAFFCGAGFILWYQKNEEKEREATLRETYWRTLGDEINHRRERLQLQSLDWPPFAERVAVIEKVRTELREAISNAPRQGTFQKQGLEELNDILFKSVLFLNRSLEEYDAYRKSEYSPWFSGS